MKLAGRMTLAKHAHFAAMEVGLMKEGPRDRKARIGRSDSTILPIVLSNIGHDGVSARGPTDL